MYQLNVTAKTWPTVGSFRTAHGSVDEIHVVNVSIKAGNGIGRGECRPYPRYNETSASVVKQIESIRPHIESGLNLANLQSLLPAGAARNAVDCALWDLKAKLSKKPIWEILGVPTPRPRITAYTLSIDSPAKMAKAALAAKKYPILKLKINGLDGLPACLAVLNARPEVQLIIDANESLTARELVIMRQKLAHLPVLLIEQPLNAEAFDQIENLPDALPILCADESLHTRYDLSALWQAGYRAVNVKLDKCGGLSEALHLMKTARSMGFVIMSGCMVSTSLAMAPMMVLESFADYIDLDGPLLLAKDIKNGLKYSSEFIYPPQNTLWG
ncbi:MAG: dipeptide epimerase [Robiginitomaculum sp.]|nr:dipeptide epimerase [Robiginitomaculum sp.]